MAQYVNESHWTSKYIRWSPQTQANKQHATKHTQIHVTQFRVLEWMVCFIWYLGLQAVSQIKTSYINFMKKIIINESTIAWKWHPMLQQMWKTCQINGCICALPAIHLNDSVFWLAQMTFPLLLDQHHFKYSNRQSVNKSIWLWKITNNISQSTSRAKQIVNNCAYSYYECSNIGGISMFFGYQPPKVILNTNLLLLFLPLIYT